MLNEIFRVVCILFSPRHFMLYLGKSISFGTVHAVVWGPPGAAKSLCVLSPFYSIVPSGSGLPSVEFVPDLELTGSMPYI